MNNKKEVFKRIFKHSLNELTNYGYKRNTHRIWFTLYSDKSYVIENDYGIMENYKDLDYIYNRPEIIKSIDDAINNIDKIFCNLDERVLFIYSNTELNTDLEVITDEPIYILGNEEINERAKENLIEGQNTISYQEYKLKSYDDLCQYLSSYCDINTNTNTERIIEQINQYFYNMKLKQKGLEFGKNLFKLNDGRYLINDYGKYCSNLSFITDDVFKFDEYFTSKELQEKINLHLDGDVYFMEGRYFKSKKGIDCFEIGNQNSPHLLIMISWGGAFNKSRGYRGNTENFLYFRNARSNGGGTGNDYIVIPKNFVNSLSIEDI